MFARRHVPRDRLSAARKSATASGNRSLKETSIASLTAQRDAPAVQIRAALDGAEFANQAIDPVQAAAWIAQAQALMTSADAMAAAP